MDATVQGNEQKYEYDIYGNRTNAYRVGPAVACLGNTTCEAPVTMSETPSTTNHLAGVTYDEAGNVTQGYDATYVYDGTGMMMRAAVGTDMRNFVYTADDERIAVKQGLSWTWSVRDQGGKVLREFTSLETSSPFALSAHIWSKDYVWRDGQLLASTSIPAGSSSPVTYHYHLNHLGTPRMITRDNGIVVSNHNYYPFGSEMDQPPQESPAEAMKFTGHERDLVAGSNHSVDYMHARYYNGNLGRFLSVDPGSVDPERPQSWNRYAYVGNSPISFSDATGRERGRYGPPPKLAPGAAREAGHKIDQFLTRVGQVGLDAVFVVGVIQSVVETGDGELFQPAAEKLESDANVILEEAETEGPVVFRGGSGIVARDSEIKVVNGEVQPSRGPSVNTDPSKVEGHGEPHKIESLPQGLTLRQIGKAGHYEIVPTAPVSKIIFQQLLNQIIRLPL